MLNKYILACKQKITSIMYGHSVSNNQLERKNAKCTSLCMVNRVSHFQGFQFFTIRQLLKWVAITKTSFGKLRVMLRPAETLKKGQFWREKKYF